jgi:hypothetical protein
LGAKCWVPSVVACRQALCAIECLYPHDDLMWHVAAGTRKLFMTSVSVVRGVEFLSAGSLFIKSLVAIVDSDQPDCFFA